MTMSRSKPRVYHLSARTPVSGVRVVVSVRAGSYLEAVAQLATVGYTGIEEINAESEDDQA